MSNTAWLRAEYAEWVTADLFRFARESKIVPDIVERPHREMSDRLMGMEMRFDAIGQKKIVFLAPRYSYKTSIIQADICRNILRYPDIALGLFRANRELSSAMLRDVKMHLTTNDLILETWGDISAGSDKWSEYEIVSNLRTRPQLSPTLVAASIGTPTTGMHFVRAYLDDLVVRENCDSIKEMQDARVLLQSINPIVGPYGRVIVTGTRWSGVDVYGWILERNRKAREKGEPPPFDEYVRAVYNLDGDGRMVPFFPDVLTPEFIEAERRELEPRYFASWYYNQTHEAGLKPFTSLCFFDGDYEPTPHPHVVLHDEAYQGETVPVFPVMLVDPALTASASSDSFGINVVGFDAGANWLVLESREVRELPSDAGNHLVELLLTYEPKIIVIESANADAEMVARLASAIAEHKLDCQIIGYSALQDESRGARGKAQRIGALEPICRNRRMFLRRGYTGPLVMQMDLYPSVEHDDVLDSLAMGRKALAFAKLPTGEVPRDEGLERPDPWRERLRAAAQKEETGVVPKGAFTGLGAQRVGR